jgi:hypothetical protein
VVSELGKDTYEFYIFLMKHRRFEACASKKFIEKGSTMHVYFVRRLGNHPQSLGFFLPIVNKYCEGKEMKHQTQQPSKHENVMAYLLYNGSAT